MILVTGGLGFIGTHTTQALLDIGARHKITGILHLAGSIPWPPGRDAPLDAADKALRTLFNVFRAASEWQVGRLGLASTIGVYGGVPADGPLREDAPLPMTAWHAIPAFKKIGELLGDHLAGALGLDVVHYRIGAIWGPLGHTPSPFFAAPQLLHAAARGATPAGPPMRAGDGLDLCYVKDCGRALALLQVADRLRHRTYNVGTGRLTTNGEVAAAIRKIVPDARVDLPEGSDHPGLLLDVARLREDTGFEPAYDTERGVAEYLAWLRAGHEL